MQNVCKCGHDDNSHDHDGCAYCRTCQMFTYSRSLSVRLSKALKMVAARKPKPESTGR